MGEEGRERDCNLWVGATTCSKRAGEEKRSAFKTSLSPLMLAHHTEEEGKGGMTLKKHNLRRRRLRKTGDTGVITAQYVTANEQENRMLAKAHRIYFEIIPPLSPLAPFHGKRKRRERDICLWARNNTRVRKYASQDALRTCVYDNDKTCLYIVRSRIIMMMFL